MERLEELGDVYFATTRLGVPNEKDAESIGRLRTKDLFLGGLHTPLSDSTQSDEVLGVAREWIERCCKHHEACPNKISDSWYPKRLIDLGRVARGTKRESLEQVRLIETDDLLEDGPVRDRFYVTLSHCWGNAQFECLTEKKLDQFYKSIKITSLPPTFQHAIHFARRLSKKVRYIWIDSLCIVQGSYDDWLSQSAQMYKIYMQSYCNLSATAASDSSKGLFFTRDPHELWEDDINLNVEGIPGKKQTLKSGDLLERCRIYDVAFWERQVDNSPVNRRAWVLQERLMAPRVLHFCFGQIAWECRELEAAESARDGLTIFRIEAGDIKTGGQLKSLIPHDNPFQEFDPSMQPYENWKRIVEVYSKTKLTKARDKLIALSGIAKMVADQVDDVYLADMWRKYLASQLLWRVVPIYKDGLFYYHSRRCEEYRAPSFSWAAVDADFGIKCGEITDKISQRGKDGELSEGLLIEVKDVIVTPVSEDNIFGLVTEGGDDLEISGMVKKIEMQVIKASGVVRYAWNLVGMGIEDVVTHRNVYLDAPDFDLDILGPEGRAYCIPVRKDRSNYLLCLILQLEKKIDKRTGKYGETGKYRRVGLAKIPPYEVGQNRVLEVLGDESEIPWEEWHAGREQHTIHLV